MISLLNKRNSTKKKSALQCRQYITIASYKVCVSKRIPAKSSSSILQQQGYHFNLSFEMASLVPRYVAGEYVAVLGPIISGFDWLLTDTGAAGICSGFIVYENDTFEVR